MNNSRTSPAGDSVDNNAPPPESTNNLEENSHILNNNGWLCGFRVDKMDGPQALTRRVASYIDGAAPMIEETNNILTETITAHNKRESNYVHQGWSNGAVATVSPWTSSRIDATNLPNPEGDWVTRRALVTRLRVQVLLEDLVPVPEFVAAIEEALDRPTRFEKFQAVYRALNRWGDVVPLEIEMGSSLSLTDTKANFAQLPATTSNSLSHLSVITTANMIRKGAASNVEWGDAAWAKLDMPATEWRLIRVIAVVPTLSLLPDDIQTRLANLHDERLSYDPPLAVDQISWPCKMHDDMKSASRTISRVDIRSGDHIVALSVTYLDGVTSQAGGNGANEQTFVLTEGL
ncbi:hypothetical protein FRC11_012413 [Ceratobasidium sp. 423]|nr:hypothetical protein FRC11_012413 [Ceratobasidium sp. 423]